MAINRNLSWETTGAGRAESSAPPATRRTGGRAMGAGAAAAAARSAASEIFASATPAAAASAGASAPSPASTRPVGDTPPPFIPPQVFEIPPRVFIPPANKTTTQIAQAAVNQLTGATPVSVREAVANIKNKNVSADDLLNYLERRTRVGEVLNELANDWSDQTKQDFAEAFQMPATADKLPVMDSIVSISILNDPELRGELQVENTTEPSSADLMENRRIVWQWPQPGTPFTPPYVMMVAVEQQDTTQAQNVIQSILGDLVDFQGYKIPRAAMQKLSGGVVPGRPTFDPGSLILNRGNR